MSRLTPDESSSLPRREFLKLVLAGSAGAAAASCHERGRAMAPLLVPEEELPSGVATWSRGLCRQCDAGCGVLVKRMEAVVPLTIGGKPFRQSRLVAKKLEGNPDHPLNRGGLCARGQAALEATYHPLRLTQPLRRTGERGSGQMQPVSWSAALSELQRRIAATPAAGVAWLGRPLRGTEAELVREWLQRLGARWWEYRALPAPRALADEERLGHLAESDFVLSFGNFLEAWPAQAPTTRAYSHFRRQGRGAFIQVEPRLSLTAASADRWISIRPGTEGVFALGVAALLAARSGSHTGSPAPQGLEAYTPAAVALTCDVPEDALRETARALAAARRPLVVGGPAAYAYVDGAFHERAIEALAELAGAGRADPASAARPSAAVPRPGNASADDTGAAPVPLPAPLPPPPQLLIVHEANPVFSAPPGWGLTAWLRAVPEIVVLGTFPDETALHADLVLPLSSTLESWTDDERRPAGALVATLNPPAMQPLHDTRSLLEIVAALDAGDVGSAATAGQAAAAGEAAIQHRWRELQTQYAPGGDFDRFWGEALERGFWAPAAPVPAAPRPAREVAASPPLPPPTAPAPASDYPLYLRLYESPLMGDGAGSWLTWLQELPDPTTSAMWSSWVEVHPELARRLGLSQGDGVWVESSAGRIELPVFLYPGLRQDTVAIPTGQGHRTSSAIANQGANPFDLLVAERDGGSGALAWEASRVRLVPSGRRGTLPLFGRSLQHPVTHR